MHDKEDRITEGRSLNGANALSNEIEDELIEFKTYSTDTHLEGNVEFYMNELKYL